jgi:hypothetical protein
MAQSGHPHRLNRCPLSGVKQTSCGRETISAFDPKRTFVAKFCWDAQRCSRSELHTITLAHDHLSRSRAHHKQWVAINYSALIPAS